MQKYKDCYDFAKSLPYFGVKEGKIYLKLKIRIIDFHTHLGISYLFAKPIDYMRKLPYTVYQFPLRDVPVLPNLYSGLNLAKYVKKGSFLKKLGNLMITSKGDMSTLTIPNLIEEMDRFKIEKSVVLALDMPFSARMSREYLKHTDNKRLVFYCFVNPINLMWRKKMKSFVKNGAKGLKIHPFFMMSSPSHHRTMKVIKEWSKYNLPVFFHSGYSGIEPKFTRRWCEMDKFEKPIKMFPNIIFILGHTGCLFYEKAVKLSKRYENVYLDLNGQPPAAVKKVIAKADNDRLVWGSDWPFHPTVLPLGKILIGTEGNNKARNKILYENADRLLKSFK